MRISNYSTNDEVEVQPQLILKKAGNETGSSMVNPIVIDD
jgi:hypothetical protein